MLYVFFVAPILFSVLCALFEQAEQRAFFPEDERFAGARLLYRS